MWTVKRWAYRMAIGLVVACIALTLVAISQARAQGFLPPGTFVDLPILRVDPPKAPLLPTLPDGSFAPTRTHGLLPWHLVVPPPEPLRYPDMSFFGYTTGRIIPRDFLDSNGQTLR